MSKIEASDIRVQELDHLKANCWHLRSHGISRTTRSTIGNPPTRNRHTRSSSQSNDFKRVGVFVRPSVPVGKLFCGHAPQNTCWERVSRVPATLKCAKDLLQHIHPDAFVPSSLAGYQIAACCNCYAQKEQRWLVVKSQARLESDLKQLEKRLALTGSQSPCRPQAITESKVCLRARCRFCCCFESRNNYLTIHCRTYKRSKS